MKKFFLKSALFVLLPVLVGEGVWHFRAAHVPPAWYLGAPARAQNKHVDAIFVGSSRVGAAINDTLFGTLMSSALHRDVLVMNMGKGYSTAAEHYFGLRDIIQADTAHFRGCTVFVEAPDGIPDAARWTDTWVHSEWTTLLGPLLRLSDVPKLWWVSGTPLADKISVTAGTASIVLYAGNKARGELAANGDLLARRLLHSSTDSPNMDLAEAAGIRVDSAGVAATRALAVQFYAKESENQEAVSSWDATIIRDLVDMVSSAGGNVVFYLMPVSSVQARSLRTPVRNADRASFQQALFRWHAQYLAIDFSTSDADFPDLWHLRRSRSLEFTRSLAFCVAAKENTQKPMAGRVP
jgi:hypothetical protein